ncbi:tol-pal system protein YbgF [Hydrogenovibrio sp. SC-1]|uniref:tol-pal system protein YbgF n=1 Tax=Hydrogenovibrio sp. SC-1 TaxID=2065820 RepID=UPI000C7D0D47|nr:tol-pal system protein YbgF [Hydrogenovibrio sp. SC-1]PLA74758.1 tol-pal system protein YbgF [Hydrogenovibrio sp. SC-1]
MKATYLSKRVAILTLTGLVSVGMVMPAMAAQQTIEERLERLERMANNPAMIQLSRRLAEQHREIQTLYGEVDRLKYQLKQVEETQAEQYQEEDKRLSELEAAQKQSAEAPLVAVTPVVPVVTPQPEQPVTESVDESKPSTKSDDKAIEVEPATATEKKAYDAAFTLMKQSKYQAAIDDFAKFLKTYPNSQLASNSGYWQGEAEAVLGNEKKALAAFKNVYETYPSTHKAADAMLRAADILASLGEIDQAKALYEKCIKAYDHLPAAKKAQSRLKDLSGASN